MEIDVKEPNLASRLVAFGGGAERFNALIILRIVARRGRVLWSCGVPLPVESRFGLFGFKCGTGGVKEFPVLPNFEDFCNWVLKLDFKRNIL